MFLYILFFPLFPIFLCGFLIISFTYVPASPRPSHPPTHTRQSTCTSPSQSVSGAAPDTSRRRQDVPYLTKSRRCLLWAHEIEKLRHPGVVVNTPTCKHKGLSSNLHRFLLHPILFWGKKNPYSFFFLSPLDSLPALISILLQLFLRLFVHLLSA